MYTPLSWNVFEKTINSTPAKIINSSIILELYSVIYCREQTDEQGNGLKCKSNSIRSRLKTSVYNLFGFKIMYVRTITPQPPTPCSLVLN